MVDRKRSINKTYVVAKALFWLSAGIAVVAYLAFKGVEAYEVMHGGGRAHGHVIATFDDEREAEGSHRVGTVTVADYELLARGARFTGRTEGSQGS